MQKGIFIGIVLPIFFLSACGVEMGRNKENPVLIFSCIGRTTSNGGEIVEFEMIRKEKGVTEIKVVSPEHAKGLCLKKKPEEMVVEYNGLSIKNENLYLPKDSFIYEMLSMFNYLENGAVLEFISSENTVSRSRCSTGNFEVDVYNSSGFIKEMRSPKNNLVITFSQQKELD